MALSSTHEIEVRASSRTLGTWLRDVRYWPVLFPPTISGETLRSDPSGDRIRLWAMANGTPACWESERVHRVDGVSFRQAVPAPQLRSMAGRWEILDHRSTATVRLHHTWELADGIDAELVRAAVEANSTAELEALAGAAERVVAMVEFSDSMKMSGDPADALRLLWDGAAWPELLEHVEEAQVHPIGPQAHLLTMVTGSVDGTRHRTESVRVLDGSVIRYKQLSHPDLLAGHAGTWTAAPAAQGCVVTSNHVVAVTARGVRMVGGADRVEAALRAQIGANSRKTLNRVRERLQSVQT